MSTDRELLELAAKAAEIPIEWHRWPSTARETAYVPNGDVSEQHGAGYSPWNPLTNDGDALRLAVKLRIGIEINERSIVASWVDGGYEPNDVYEYPESIQNEDFDIVHVNHDKATRRAIVRAAAAIAKAGGAA